MLVGKTAGETREDDGLKMKLVWYTPGTFKMGSSASETDHGDDEAQVDVTLSGFWLGQTARGSAAGSFRVYRGGGWSYSPQNCRSAFRNGDAPEFRGNCLGFRVFRSSVK